MSELKVENQELGKCPKCGSTNLDYSMAHPQDDEMLYEVDCDDCGFTGYECHKLVFIEYIER